MNAQARGTSSASAIRAGIEDRNPADPEPPRAGGEPERVQSADGRIATRLRHRARAEAVALLRRLVAEHGQLDRRVAQPLELESRVKTRARAAVRRKRLAVGGLEIGPDRSAPRLVVDAYEARWLRVADRRRERRKGEKLVENRLVRRDAGAKMAHVAPPGEKLGESGAEAGVESGRVA